MSTPAEMCWSMFFLSMNMSSRNFKCVSNTEICLSAEGHLFDGVCCGLVDILGDPETHRAAGRNPGADG